MNSRTPELSRLTLMCRDHEVAEFTWNHDRQTVTGKTPISDAVHAPLMSTDPSGHSTRDRLSSWFKNRGIPDFRPDAVERLRAAGFPSAASLMASGFGTSLSDQYWIRPAGSTSTWRDVNCFENDFSVELGELLLPHAHRKDQGQCGYPRVLARCGTERQPPEALDGRGRPPGARQSRSAIQ